MNMETPSPVRFRDRNAWHRWLLANHGKRGGLWLIIYKKSSDKPGLRYEDALEEALCFGWIDGPLKRIDDVKHMIKFTPRRKGSVWSKINREKAERLIKEGRMTAAGEAKIKEAKKAGLWDAAYTNRKKDRMPPELKTALLKETGAWKLFQGYANSYRNMYIGWIKAAKTKETRSRRIKEVVERTIKGKKPGER